MPKKAPKRRLRNRPALPPIEVLKQAEELTVEQFALVNPAFTKGALRWQLFEREKNGLAASGAVVQLGKRILIRPRQYRQWLEQQNSLKAA